MIVLWLLVSHLIGDYLLQTRWQANGKFGWTGEALALRSRHVAAYCAAFVPVAIAFARPSPDVIGTGSTGSALLFLLWLFYLHFLTDAQRFRRTPAEWLLHRFRLVKAETLADENTRSGGHPMMAHVQFRPAPSKTLRLPWNPWPSLPLVIDQTLHLAQVATLATLFLT